MTELNLLLIEDNEDDATMVIWSLRQAGFKIYCTRVETRQAMLSELEKGGWDLIISDYNLPTYNGMEALKDVRLSNPDIPFLFLSGSVTDEVGVLAMELGANDYILKDNMERLPVAIKREIAYAQSRKNSELSDKQYRAILDTAVDAIIAIDESSNIVLFNNGAEQMFGYAARQVIGQSIDMLLPPYARASHQANVDEFNASGEPSRIFNADGSSPLFVKRKDGSEFPTSINVSRIQVGDQVTFTAIVRDISDSVALAETQESYRQQLEIEIAAKTAELEEKRVEALQLAQAKSDFLASMSHEIRTPMNAIIGLVHMLKNRDLDAESNMMVNKVHVSGQALLGIINDILDYSKIEAGKLSIEDAPFDLDDILDNVGVIMSASTRDSNVELAMIPPSQECVRVRGDALRISQVLINLVSNAIKFTKQGFVKVSVEAQQNLSDAVTLQFKVQDSGIGMSEQAKDRLFEAFSQADSSTSRHYGGTGLGLAISKRLVEKMGGELGVETQLGQGSVFWFTLTLQRADEVRTADTAQAPRPDLVLLADDNELTRFAIKMMCEHGDQAVETFADGETLSHWLSEHPEAQSPATFVIMDRDMEPLNGLQLCHHIDTTYSEAQRPIMMVLTGHSIEDTQDMFSGYSVLVASKPLARNTLFESYQQLLNQQTQGSHKPSSGNKGPKPLKHIKILIVDDNEINLDVAQMLLEDQGASTITASSGDAALQLLLEGEEKVDAVLMDIQMPGLDGYHTTTILRGRLETHDLPIIGLSANVLKEDVDKALKKGMDDYLSKPIDVPKTVETILRLVATGSRAKVSASHSAPAQKPTLPLIDIEFIENTFGNTGIFTTLAHKFVAQYAAVQFDDSDLSALKELAHQMKGVAGNIGLRRLSSACDELQLSCLYGGDTDHLRLVALDILQDTLQALQAISKTQAKSSV